MIPQRLDADTHGRLIVLAGLTDIRSDTLGQMLSTHSIEFLWNALRGGRAVEFARRSGNVLPLPAARAQQWGFEIRAADPAAAATAHQRAGVSVLAIGQPGYPESFQSLDDPPGVIFVQGDPSLLTDFCPGSNASGSSGSSGSFGSSEHRRTAIVGTRRATSYGRQMARSLGRSLAAAGVEVVSGLAAGIDGAAHAGALCDRADSDARPIAVVGSGLDHPYPSANRELWNSVRCHGALVSEWPLGARPIAWHFPARNRLIVGLSEAVVVVESAATGGSMITVKYAQQRGVPVLCVPGLLTSPASVGPHQVLADGGAVCRGADDVLIAMGMLARGSALRPGLDPRRQPSVDGAAVLSGLGWDVLPVERLMTKFPNCTPGTLLLALHELEFDGWVTRGSDGWFQLAATGGR